MPPDIQFMLGEMNAKLDSLIRRGAEDRAETAALKARVSSLEADRAKLLGAAAVLGGAAGLLAKVLG